MSPSHGGNYTPSANAYYGAWDNAGQHQIIRVLPNPANTWQYLGRLYLPTSRNSFAFEDFQVGDNNGFSSGIIGMGQIKMICPFVPD